MSLLRKVWGIRHIRWFYHLWAYHVWWVGYGQTMWLDHHPSDMARLEAIRKGEA